METTVNQRISEIISELKITKNSFADKLGVAGSVIYNIINNRNKPGFDLLAKIVSLFDVNPEYLIVGKGNIFSSKSGTEMNHNFEPRMNPSIHTPKMGGDFGGRMGENDEKNIDDDLSGAIISALCGSYNKRNGTDFGYNSFPLLSSEFRVITNYVDFLQKMLVAEVRKELFAFAKNRYEATGSTSAEIPEELDEILDKYVKIYTILEESAEKGTSVINDLNGLIEMLRKKHNI